MYVFSHKVKSKIANLWLTFLAGNLLSLCFLFFVSVSNLNELFYQLHHIILKFFKKRINFRIIHSHPYILSEYKYCLIAVRKLTHSFWHICNKTSSERRKWKFFAILYDCRVKLCLVIIARFAFHNHSASHLLVTNYIIIRYTSAPRRQLSWMCRIMLTDSRTMRHETRVINALTI